MATLYKKSHPWFLLLLLVLGLSHPFSKAEAAPSAEYEKLTKLLLNNPKTQKPVESIEELVPLLSAELRENFTFIYQSRSPHGGLGDPKKNVVTYEFPRTVLFTRDTRLMLAFTGDPTKPGYDVLETIYFDDAAAAFRLSKYILPAAVKKDPLLSKEATLNGQENPAECLRCHGQDPRPFTDSYPLWPGFYGSVRDTFPKKSPELPFYRKFIKAQKNAKTGVYHQLSWPKGTSVPPYLDPAKYNPNTVEGSLNHLKFLPNTRLGMALTELNRRRLQRKLEASPQYQKYKYAILSGFLGCSYLPINEQDVSTVYDALVLENADRLQRLGSVPVGPGATDLNMMELGFYGNVVQVLYLAKALEVNSGDWSMAFEDHSLSYFDGILSSVYEDKDFYLKEDFLLEMLREASSKEPEFRPFFHPYAAYMHFGYPFGLRLDLAAASAACPLLLKKQKANPIELPPMSTTAAPLQVEKQNSSQEILQKIGLENEPFARCISCHEGQAALFTGRKIPFREPKMLRAKLNAKSTSSDRTLYEEILERVRSEAVGHMPPHGEQLNASEINALDLYLSKVKKR